MSAAVDIAGKKMMVHLSTKSTSWPEALQYGIEQSAAIKLSAVPAPGALAKAFSKGTRAPTTIGLLRRAFWARW